MMSTKAKAIAVAVFFAVLAIGGYAASVLEAKEIGEACESYHQDCGGPGGACLVTETEKYCSISCKQDTDCPATWTCQAITSETYSTSTGEKVESEDVHMCIKP